MIQKNKENNLMNGFILGASIVAISGICSALWYNKKRHIHADDVLNRVKKAFLQEGPIEGSWIEFEKKTRRKFALQSETYVGGISRWEDQSLVSYEFVADASTGTVIDIVRNAHEDE